MMRWLTAPAVVVLLLSSCSAVTLTYENAHWLLLRQMDRFFDLSWRQTHDAFERLKAVGNAHRRDELPRILEQLALAERMVADGLARFCHQRLDDA